MMGRILSPETMIKPLILTKKEIFMKTKYLFITIILAFFTCTLTGCGSGRVIDASTPEHHQNIKKVNSVAIHAVQSPIPVTPEVRKDFEDALAKNLYEEVKFKKGNELAINYKFTSLCEGSQFQRWFTGGLGGAGEGTLIIEASFVDVSGKEVGRVKSEGRIGAGFFGGSFSNALERAAEEIAKYTAHSFKENAAEF